MKTLSRSDLILLTSAVLFLLVMIGLFFYSINRGHRTNPVDDAPSNFDASYYCHKFVADRLKAPSTAQFPSSFEEDIHNTSSTFIVKSYVDSQNSFGAMLRTSYTCNVFYNGHSWLLNSLTFP